MLFHNPVFHRESRVRWRDWRSFGLLFFYAMALSYVLGWSYATNGAGNRDPRAGEDLATTGREVFRTLQMMQMCAWLLIVPILTSTIISSERERGLLEALQLSGLRARHIIGGKLGAILLFVILLLLAGAPVTSICFLLGGVAPEEFLKSLLLQAMTIFLCAAIGLFYSAQARRSLIAVRNAFIVMLIFAGGTAFLFTLNHEMGINEIEEIAAYGTLLNPIRAQIGVFDNFAATYPELASVTWIKVTQPFHVTLSSLALFSLLFLWGAARGVRKVIDDAQWMERKRYLTLQRGRFKWRAVTIDETALARWRGEDQPAAESDLKSKASALFDTPLATFIHFQNPILQREVRGKLRLRRYPKPVTFLMSGMATLGGIAYMWLIFSAWSDKQSHQDIWSLSMFCSLCAITLTLPLMGASTLPRERDNGTWEMLELSLLPPRKLLAGKLLAPLFFVATLFLLMLPVLLPTVHYVTFDHNTIYGGPSLPYALAALILLAATSFCYTAWGMWLSLFFRAPVQAMAVTLVAMLIILGFLPWSLEFFLTSASGRDGLNDFLNLWHPWVTLSQLCDASTMRYNGDYNGSSNIYNFIDALPCIIFLVLAGTLLLFDLNRRITKAWRLSPRRKRRNSQAKPYPPVTPLDKPA